ncbi:FAD-binding oxidoreductase [Chishuiella sp.]|uniref:FAD-binding oxidoreductase n=1 Tax=Chishuiella sp. TaxID=1969467 RepID=UPI0028AA640A|nr:FAD-binding oxidoreductase [Chishuiella sp.]
MNNKKLTPVANWGLYPAIKANVVSPTTLLEFQEAILSNKDIIARGNGRCYGDASLQNTIISTSKWNKFIAFDRENGIIEVESGVRLDEVLEASVPAGFFISVTPGTKFITVGGAISSDVHGKNHHVDGCFSDHVIHFDLMIEDGSIIRCSRNENENLFWSTIGGMGLTGVILSAKFLLKKIETSYIRNEAIQAKNLDEIFELFESSESWTYNVAWLDCLQKGNSLGKSIMLRGEHATINELPDKLKNNPLKIKKKLNLNIPFFFPGFVLNSLSIRIFNWIFFNKQGKKHLKNYVDYETFFYPLDAVHNWNRIYGKNGFIQYQFVIPKEKGKEGMRKILETIAKSGNGSFLVVLKLFGDNNPQAYNSFPMKGYTLALDFKVNSGLEKLVKDLDKIVMEYGGHIYRTKDAMSNPALTNYLKNVDSDKFESMQSERINRLK